jgi:hypothetical protein
MNPTYAHICVVSTALSRFSEIIFNPSGASARMDNASPLRRLPRRDASLGMMRRLADDGVLFDAIVTDPPEAAAKNDDTKLDLFAA